jgi:hypothetical protein
MCGALVVAPKGLVYQDRLDTIRHVGYEGAAAPWGEVLERCDYRTSSFLARQQTWSKVASRMLEWFQTHS